MILLHPACFHLTRFHPHVPTLAASTPPDCSPSASTKKQMNLRNLTKRRKFTSLECKRQVIHMPRRMRNVRKYEDNKAYYCTLSSDMRLRRTKQKNLLKKDYQKRVACPVNERPLSGACLVISKTTTRCHQFGAAHGASLPELSLSQSPPDSDHELPTADEVSISEDFSEEEYMPSESEEDYDGDEGDLARCTIHEDYICLFHLPC